MKKILPFLVLAFLTLNLTHTFAQAFEDEMVKLPKGTVLTLKEDFIIQPFIGIIELNHESTNYNIYNLVFNSKDKRRILRKGTQFTVKEIEVAVGKLYIHIENKINWVYFGEVKDRDSLTIGELRGVFDIEFPGLEEF